MIPLFIAFAIILIISAVLLYVMANYHCGYWRRRGISGPPPKPFVGNLNEWFHSEAIALQLQKWTLKYGKTYGIQEGRTNMLVTSDVDLLNELFVKKFDIFHGRKSSPLDGNVDKFADVHVFSARGARWKRLRAIANPVFSVNNLKKILPIIHDSVYVMMEHFEKVNGKIININEHFQELAMDVIMRIAMGQKGTRQFNNYEHIKIIKLLFKFFADTRFYYWGRIAGPWFYDICRRAMKLYVNATRQALSVVLIYIYDEISKRKMLRNESNNSNIVDLIDLLLDAECSSSEITDDATKTFNKTTAKISKHLTVHEIVSQCFLFLVAGFDTTANTLSAVCHYLARNEHAQNCLREEVLSVLGDNEESTYEKLNELQYTDAVIKETLRLCPIAASVCARECSKTTTLGNYIIEEGTIVQVDVFSLQRDKTIWGDDADEFRPERWLEGNSRPNLSWIPFGAGPRICLGMRLANLEMKHALAAFFSKFLIKTTPESEPFMVLHGDSVLDPERVTVKIEHFKTD